VEPVIPAGRRPGRSRRAGRRGLRLPRAAAARAWQRTATLAGAAAVASLLLPSGVSSATPARPQPSLSQLVAQAKVLSEQINTLSEQYDGLRIQLSQARAEAKVAARTYAMDAARLGTGRLMVGQLAAQSYMTGGLDSSLQLLTSSSPQVIINRAAIIQQLQQENGDKITQLATAEAAALRARATAEQQSRQVATLVAAMARKQNVIQQKINVLNSATFAKAMAIFNQTGQYPSFTIPTQNTIGAEALRYALTRRGDPYVWGAAGPNAFDCSGLVMWAYAQVGISLPHYTVAQYNMGVHVAQSQLQPGDLVFFYAGIQHVGLYIGNGLMVDAPDFGQTVKVEPVMWNVYVGAVRIVG
jgi:cell wall-associated NlpC family hydrolase